MPKLEYWLEAEKRGLLSPKNQALLDEARRRGIVKAAGPSAPGLSQPTIQPITAPVNPVASPPSSAIPAAASASPGVMDVVRQSLGRALPVAPVASTAASIGEPVANAMAPTVQPQQRPVSQPEFRAPNPTEARFDRPDLDTGRPGVVDYLKEIPIAGETINVANEVLKTNGENGQANESLMMNLISYPVLGKALEPVTKAAQALIRNIGMKIARSKGSEAVARAAGGTLESGIVPVDLENAVAKGYLSRTESEFYRKQSPEFRNLLKEQNRVAGEGVSAARSPDPGPAAPVATPNAQPPAPVKPASIVFETKDGKRITIEDMQPVAAETPVSPAPIVPEKPLTPELKAEITPAPGQTEPVPPQAKPADISVPRTIPVLPKKSELLIKIQEAIDKAPDIISVNQTRTNPLGEYPADTPTISFQMDGGAKIYNTKAALTEFQRRIKSLPEKMKTLEDGPTIPKIGNPSGNKLEQTGLLLGAEEGYYTDGVMMARGTAPAGSKIDTANQSKIPAKVFEDILSTKTQPAEFQNFMIDRPTIPEGGVSDKPIQPPSGKTSIRPVAIIKSNNKYWKYDQGKYLHLTNRFPNAKIGVAVGENPVLVFTENGQPVAAMMPVAEGSSRTGISYDENPMPQSFGKSEEFSDTEGLMRPDAEALNSQHWQVSMPTEASTTKTVNKTEIMGFIEKTFKVPIKGKATFKWKHAGVYYNKDKIIRMQKWGELEVASHELAHHIDKMLGIRQQLAHLPSAEAATLRAELKKLDYEPEKKRISEGFAEYIRHRLTVNDSATVAPTFDKYFNETFLAKQPALKKNLDDLHGMMNTWQQQGAENRILEHIDFNGEHTDTLSTGERMGKAWRWWQDNFVDSLWPLKRVEKALGKEVGVNMRPSESPFSVATMKKATAGRIARAFVETNAIDEIGNPVGPSLRKVLDPIAKKDMRAFITYAVAKRAVWLHKRNIESGFDINDATYILQKYNDKPEWDAVVDGITKWSDQVLDWVSRAGGLDSKAREIMRNLNPIYLPFKRAFSEELEVVQGVGGSAVGGSPIKRIHGSGRPIINPIESMITQVEQLIGFANQLSVTNALRELAVKSGAGGFIQRVPTPIMATKFKAGEVVDQLKELGYDVKSTGEGEMDPEDIDGQAMDELLTVFTKAHQYNGKDNIVPLWNKGKQEFYEIHPEVFKAIQSLQPQQASLTIRILSPFARGLRLGATGLKASFGLATNPFRDALTRAVFSKYRYATPLDSFSGILKDLTADAGPIREAAKRAGMLPGSVKEDNNLATRFKQTGGELSGQMGGDREATMNAYDELLLSKLGAKGKALKIVKHPINTLREIFSINEMAPRIMELEQSYSMNKKVHPDWSDNDLFVQAFNDAGDVTINFRKSGTVGRQINQAAAFFNVAIQGPNKMYRAFTDKPVETTIRGIAWLTTLALGTYYLNKDKQWYKNLASSYKYNNIFFEVGDTVYRLPLPYDIGTVFAATPMAAIDSIRSNGDPQYLEGLLSQAGSQIPNPMPSAFGPTIDVLRNRDFLNRPIEGEGKKYEYFTHRVQPYTTRVAKAISSAINVLSMEKVQLSPIQIDYLMNQHTGGAIRQAPMNGIQSKDYLPILTDFIVSMPEKPTRQLNNFFEDWDTLSKKKKSGILSPKQNIQFQRVKNFHAIFLKTYLPQIRRYAAAKNDAATRNLYQAITRRLEMSGYK